MPPLQERFRQLDSLSRRFGSRCIHWRFDPVTFYRMGPGPLRHNLRHFDEIATAAQACGIHRCITSFMDLYAKVKRRAATVQGLTFVDPTPEHKLEIIRDMEQKTAARGIRLHLCCEKPLLNRLPPDQKPASSSCIPNDLLVELYGPGISLRKDAGQRTRSGCGCKVSMDVGDYRCHPCFHRCLYCYANPAAK